MITLQEYKQSKDAKVLIRKMFEARQVAHNCHLKTKSYAEHEALGGFYKSLVDFADDFAETYQGQYGLIGDLDFKVETVSSPLEYLEDCVKLFAAGRDGLKDAHLQNIVDEVVSLTYKTIYKIKFLK